jgi:hypothetical protein
MDQQTPKLIHYHPSAKDMARVNITIDPQSDAIAKDLGEGDRSLGIRRALAIAKEQQDGTHQQVRNEVRSTQPERTAYQYKDGK